MQEGGEALIVGSYDVLILFLLGFLLGWPAKRLHKRNRDAFIFMLDYVTLAFWLNFLLSNLGLISCWGGKLPSFSVPFWLGFFYILSYPFWFWFGGTLFFGLFGRTPSHGGIFWALTIDDKTEPFAGWQEEEPLKIADPLSPEEMARVSIQEVTEEERQKYQEWFAQPLNFKVVKDGKIVYFCKRREEAEKFVEKLRLGQVRIVQDMETKIAEAKERWDKWEYLKDTRPYT